jgi:O-methyltransferase
LEFGVYKGDSIKGWTNTNTNTKSRFFGFDSFFGLPEDWKSFTVRLPKGTFDMKGRMPSIHDRRVHLIKGIFQKTLPNFLMEFDPKNRLVIHCDADLYTSTLYALATMDKISIPGSIVIFDEFSCFHNEFKALLDYSSSFMRKYNVIASTSDYSQLAIKITS